ncbi:hypothetical protein AVEN_70030-1, partial [Araneus ventricosus]
HSRLAQEVLNEEGESEKSIPPKDIAIDSLLAQEALNRECINEDSSIPENRVLYSELSQEELGEESNSQASSSPDNTVLHSPIVQKGVDKTENNTVPSSIEIHLRETNRNSSLSLQNTEHDYVEIGESCRQDDNTGRMEYSETIKGSIARNKSAAGDDPVAIHVARNKSHFAIVSPDINQELVVAETDKTINTKHKHLDETFDTTEDDSSYVIKTHSNHENKNQEKISLQELKMKAYDFEAGAQEGGSDKNLKSTPLDKTFIDQNNSLSYMGFDRKNIKDHQNVYQQSIQDNEQNFDKTISEEILSETVRNFFKHRNRLNRSVHMPTNVTTKQNQKSIINFKDIKSKPEEAILHQDTNAHLHPENTYLACEVQNYLTQANASAEGDDNTDFELSKHPDFKTKQFKLRENMVLKSKYKQRKRKTLLMNNSVSEDQPTDISGAGNNSESNFNIHNSMMQSPSTDSQKQESSNNQNSFIEAIEENIYQEIDFSKEREKTSNNRSNALVFGSPQFPLKDSETPSNDNLERSSLETETCATANTARHETDFEKISSNLDPDFELSKYRCWKKKQLKSGEDEVLKSKYKQRKRKTQPENRSVLEDSPTDVSGSEKRGEPHDYSQTSHMSHLGGASVENKQSVDSDDINILNSMMQRLSTDPQKKEPSNNQNSCIAACEENTLKSKSSISSFGCTKQISKQPNSILERSSFQSYTSVNEAHWETDFSKEKEKTSNIRSNAFESGSTQLSMKAPQTLLTDILKRNPFESYTVENEAHQVPELCKVKEKISNNRSNNFVFGSTQLSMNVPEKPLTNILENRPFESHTTANEAHHEINLNKEKEKPSHIRSNNFVFGSTELSMNVPKKLLTNILERSSIESHTTANEVNHEISMNKEKGV